MYKYICPSNEIKYSKMEKRKLKKIIIISKSSCKHKKLLKIVKNCKYKLMFRYYLITFNCKSFHLQRICFALTAQKTTKQNKTKQKAEIWESGMH